MQLCSITGKATTSLRKRAAVLDITVAVENNAENIRKLVGVGMVAACSSQIGMIRMDYAMEMMADAEVSKAAIKLISTYRATANEAKKTGIMPASSEEESGEEHEE